MMYYFKKVKSDRGRGWVATRTRTKVRENFGML